MLEEFELLLLPINGLTTNKWSFIYAGSLRKKFSGDKSKIKIDDHGAKLKVLDKSVEHELYHLPSDPRQKNNLFEKKKSIAKKLQTGYTKFLEKLGTEKKFLKYWRSL